MRHTVSAARLADRKAGCTPPAALWYLTTGKPKPPKFTGALRDPIETNIIFPFGVVPGSTKDEQKIALQEKLLDCRFKKLLALLKYYGISKNDKQCWLKLCLAMAINFVPGMSAIDRRKTPGRPRGQGIDIKEFCSTIENIQARNLARGRRLSVEAAIKVIKSKPTKWRGSTATLKARYYRFKRSETHLQRVLAQMAPTGLLAHLFPRKTSPQ